MIYPESSMAQVSLPRRSGVSGSGSFDINYVDTSCRFPFPKFFRRSCGAEAEERFPIHAAESTSNSSTAGQPYSLALLVDPDEGVLTEGRDPNGPITIQTNAVRILHTSKAIAQPQSPIRLYLILGQTFAIHLGNEKPAVIGRDCDTVWKTQAIGDNSRPTIQHHQNNPTNRASVRRWWQI